MHTGVFKIRVIVALYQLRGRVGAKMLGIDTILETVCIAEMSIYSEVLANVGRWPTFFVPGNRGVALRQRRRKRRQYEYGSNDSFLSLLPFFFRFSFPIEYQTEFHRLAPVL